MIAPQMPAGGLIGQAILHDESHGQRNDAMGVAGFGRSIFGRVRVEESVALGATVLRIDEIDVAGSTSDEVAQVVQHPGARPIAKARFPASRARETWIVATASDDLCFGKIFRARDALGGIWQILTGTRHSNALRGQLSSA